MPRELRRNFTLKLTLRQLRLLRQLSVAERRPIQSALRDVLAPFFAGLEQRFGPELDPATGLDRNPPAG